MGKIAFPYSWLNKARKETSFEFGHYVMARNALYSTKDAATIDLDAVPMAGQPSGFNALDWTYGVLNILDAKASALMRLNGVMLAAAAFLLNPQYHAVEFVRFLVAASALGSAISIFACLLVASVDWPFLGLVVPKTDTNDKQKVVAFNFSDEFFYLQQVAEARRRRFQFAWIVSLVTTLAFLLALAFFFATILFPGSQNNGVPVGQ